MAAFKFQAGDKVKLIKHSKRTCTGNIWTQRAELEVGLYYIVDELSESEDYIRIKHHSYTLPSECFTLVFRDPKPEPKIEHIKDPFVDMTEDIEEEL